MKSEAFSFFLVAWERATFAFGCNPATVARIYWPFHSLGRSKKRFSVGCSNVQRFWANHFRFWFTFVTI